MDDLEDWGFALDDWVVQSAYNVAKQGLKRGIMRILLAPPFDTPEIGDRTRWTKFCVHETSANKVFEKLEKPEADILRLFYSVAKTA